MFTLLFLLFKILQTIDCKAQLCHGQITLTNGKITIQPISDSKTYRVIHQIEFNPVDSIIQPLDNQRKHKHTVKFSVFIKHLTLFCASKCTIFL